MDFASLEPLPGGWSGRTFLARVADEHQVVRIVPPGTDPDRGEHPHEVDAALMRLVRGLLPVPEVLDVRRGDPAADTPGLLVTSLLPGERGDLVVARLDAAGQARLGAEVGLVAARLGAIPQPHEGPFLDASLRVGRFAGPTDLRGWVEELLPALASRSGWSQHEGAGLLEVADEAQDRLETIDRMCLVHSDLNLKNLLVDPDSLVVTGVVDWEFARAGHPFADLGNALRFDRHPAWVEAVLGTYRDRLGVPAGLGDGEALDLARAADLLALLTLAVRRGENPVADHAERQLHAIAVDRDLHAASD